MTPLKVPLKVGDRVRITAEATVTRTHLAVDVRLDGGLNCTILSYNELNAAKVEVIRAATKADDIICCGTNRYRVLFIDRDQMKAHLIGTPTTVTITSQPGAKFWKDSIVWPT